MLVGLLYGLFVLGVLKAFEEPYIDIIEGRGEKGEDLITARKMLAKIRYVVFGASILLLAILVCFVLPLFYESDSSFNNQYSQLFSGILTGLLIVLRKNKKYSHYGKISSATIEDVRNCKEDYVVYLRAFEKDDYSGKNKRNRFSERKFMSCFPKWVYSFAIGMTKEIDTPIGATRIYCDDNHWRENVKEMVKGAKAVVVYVSDRDSCIWEINCLRFYTHKVFFISDDLEKYKNAEKISILPELNGITLKSSNILLVSGTGLRYNFETFPNRKRGYKKITNYIQLKCDFRRRKKSMAVLLINVGFFCSFVLPIVAMIFIVIGLHKAESNCENNPKLALPAIIISCVVCVVQTIFTVLLLLY